MGAQLAHDLQPFRSVDGLIATVQTISALVARLDPRENLPSLAEKAVCISGSPRIGEPEAFLYVAPQPSSHRELFADLIEALPNIPGVADQARLVYLAIQLIHPLPDTNGRVGRVMHQAVIEDVRWNVRALSDLVDRCPFAVEGTGGKFEDLVVHPDMPIYQLGRYGIFSQIFGQEASINTAAIISPELDGLGMTGLSECLATLPGFRSELLESLGGEMLQIGRQFAPLKVLLANSKLEAPSGLPNLRVVNDTKDGSPVWRMDNVVASLKSLPFDQLQSLTHASQFLANQLIKHLINCYVHPECYPSLTDDQGSVAFLKDTFDTQRFPKMKRAQEYR